MATPLHDSLGIAPTSPASTPCKQTCCCQEGCPPAGGLRQRHHSHKDPAAPHRSASRLPSATWMRACSARQPRHQACRQSSRAKARPGCSSMQMPQVCRPSWKAACSCSALYLRRGRRRAGSRGGPRGRSLLQCAGVQACGQGRAHGAPHQSSFKRLKIQLANRGGSQPRHTRKLQDRCASTKCPPPGPACQPCSPTALQH